jgi:hypothetical protein
MHSDTYELATGLPPMTDCIVTSHLDVLPPLPNVLPADVPDTRPGALKLMWSVSINYTTTLPNFITLENVNHYTYRQGHNDRDFVIKKKSNPDLNPVFYESQDTDQTEYYRAFILSGDKQVFLYGYGDDDTCINSEIDDVLYTTITENDRKSLGKRLYDDSDSEDKDGEEDESGNESDDWSDDD